MKKEEILKIIKEIKESIGKERVDKIIDFYERGDARKYIEYLSLKRDLKLKSVHRTTLYGWKKGRKPDAIKALISIHRNNFHKIDKRVLSRLIGYGFGDGGINKKFQRYFICGKKEDLENISQYIKKNIPKVKPIIEKNNGSGSITNSNKETRYIKGGKSWILSIKNAIFSRFLHSLDLPNGQKVLQKTNIPKWIKKSNNKIKIEFLEGILEGENQKHRVKFIAEKNKIEIPTISMGFGKEIKYKSNLIEFLSSIKDLLEEFDIKCGNVEEVKLSNIRKRDGKITCFSRFHIYSSALNVIKFSRIIKYRFNEEKRLALNIAINEAKTKLKRFETQKEKFKEASKLFNQGMNYSQIARELDVSHITIKNWVVKKEHLPRHLNIDLGGFING